MVDKKIEITPRNIIDSVNTALSLTLSLSDIYRFWDLDQVFKDRSKYDISEDVVMNLDFLVSKIEVSDALDYAISDKLVQRYPRADIVESDPAIVLQKTLLGEYDYELGSDERFDPVKPLAFYLYMYSMNPSENEMTDIFAYLVVSTEWQFRLWHANNHLAEMCSVVSTRNNIKESIVSDKAYGLLDAVPSANSDTVGSNIRQMFREHPAHDWIKNRKSLNYDKFISFSDSAINFLALMGAVAGFEGLEIVRRNFVPEENFEHKHESLLKITDFVLSEMGITYLPFGDMSEYLTPSEAMLNNQSRVLRNILDGEYDEFISESNLAERGRVYIFALYLYMNTTNDLRDVISNTVKNLDSYDDPRANIHIDCIKRLGIDAEPCLAELCVLAIKKYDLDINTNLFEYDPQDIKYMKR